ncbi:putative dimethyl sulfoxide reductase chain YnfF [Sporomusa carbonis]|uniref:molybdopterin-containing oxidoreductase family protein n=1 Tax=Sporomusa carbonis TaxID=3076075 RepID=UPI003A6D266C
MLHRVVSACPLDCPDVCSLIVTVEDGVVVSVEGNPAHPVTRGAICNKGRNLIKNGTHPGRIKTPMLKQAGVWCAITWAEALDLFYNKLKESVSQYGSLSILHAAGDGSAGLIKQRLPKRFFNQLGGVTEPGGSLCWGAGIAAQKADFGLAAAPSWKDITKAKTILLWGRDPATTNIHLLPYINEARQAGAQVIVINPLKVPSLKFADKHLAVRPGTDGLLALAMAQVIIAENLTDGSFCAANVNGYQEYARMAAGYRPASIAEIVGVDADEICEVARTYAQARPASIILGYGLQRYEHGGATIRAIDALAAITGQIGKPGAGVHYANRLWGQFGKEIAASEQTRNTREIPWAQLAARLPELDPPIKVLVVDRGNPVNQMADSTKTRTALLQIPFKVAIDYYLTDTAEIADLFLPATGNFEEEDLVVSSWNEYIYYKPAITRQPFSEYGIWQYLAKRFGLGAEWEQEHSAWLKTTLNSYGVTLTDLQEKGFLLNPNAENTAFTNGKFLTDSGKFELLGAEAIRNLIVGCQSMVSSSKAQHKKLVLITPHRRHSLNSQHFPPQDSPGPVIKLNPVDGQNAGLAEGDSAVIETTVGKLVLPVSLDAGILAGVAVIEQGGWLKDGLGVNLITESRNTDIGDQVAFYHTFCTVRKA